MQEMLDSQTSRLVFDCAAPTELEVLACEYLSA